MSDEEYVSMKEHKFALHMLERAYEFLCGDYDGYDSVHDFCKQYVKIYGIRHDDKIDND